jgi:Cu(I)/Ag(I) efflux system membrane protein CusA/SilA
MLAQMGGEGGASPRPKPGGSRGPVSDAPALDWSQALPRVQDLPLGARGQPSGATAGSAGFVPLGQVADVRIMGGPPMLRDEGGLLVGYVYVDVDPSVDIGSYVAHAKEEVAEATQAGGFAVPPGYFLKWTGQYELLEKMNERLRMVIPLTLIIIIVLLLWHFRNVTEVLIVLLSIPFALVGSVWLLWLLDYRLSTAVWVGIIALVGLAAQTGIVMIVYIDTAYERRRKAGKIRDLDDIIWAHMEGTVMRVRPKLMTVGTMLVGLLPLLWATGSGADVMKRIAAPMVGGLITSAFLTLEIIPVVYTYWRQEQLLWERLEPLDPVKLRRLRLFTTVQQLGWVALLGVGMAAIYTEWPRMALWALLVAPAAAVLGGLALYLRERPSAHRRVWPGPAGGAAA